MAGPGFPHLHGDAGAKVGVVFGSASDWPTMQITTDVLRTFGVLFEYGIVSAHRTPDRLREYATTAAGRGLEVVIAGAGGAAHLPGMLAAWSLLPVLGVPVESRKLKGLDSLYSIVQMPGGVPVGTLAIGESGARNAALLAIRILATRDEGLREKLADFHAEQAESSVTAALT
ncbi:MAG: 5-(carboxyamino)imidazole ribonucleotide mutase [Gemmatimonadota bacterium]